MKWISVKDRMPILYQWVLVCDSPQGTGEPQCINICRWNGYEWEGIGIDEDSPTFSDIWYFMGMKEITHWMPLPEAPDV